MRNGLTHSLPRVGVSSSRKGSAPFAFALMEKDRHALDRLDISFRWGGYGIRLLRCHLTSFPPGKTVSFHKHSEFEFHFIPRGKGTVILKDKEYALQDGLFYLTGPGMLHYQEADQHEAMDELCLHVDIQPLPDFGADGHPRGEWGTQWELQEADACIRQLQSLPTVPIMDQYNAMQWFLIAYQAWFENQQGAYTTIKQAVIQIMLCAVRSHAGQETRADIPERDMNEHRYQLAVRFIQDNYASLMTLEDVAEKLNISGRQLQRIIGERGGTTFREYLENVRLTHVCRRLLKGERPLERIAAENGFSSSNYLYYVFKKRFGMTPGEYRQQKLTAERTSFPGGERRRES